MSDFIDPHTRLIAETLQGEWTGLPASLARRAAASARRRRRTRRALIVTGFSAAATSVFVLVGVLPRQDHIEQKMAARSPVSAAYEIISDDELLATVRDRPLLAITSANGQRDIVVLPN